MASLGEILRGLLSLVDVLPAHASRLGRPCDIARAQTEGLEEAHAPITWSTLLLLPARA